ncbi:MAG TPA: head GIN domain-containing protein [Bacteroidales bacterium]|nr:head GIN domain-containing protein [Bacteroidales bacterium]HRZ49602.1 head GIN domain-containing protein [Bacteroidales bacterium]
MEPIKIVIRIALMVLFLGAIVFFVRFCTGIVSDPDKGMVGDGNLVRRNIPVEQAFQSVEVSGSINVYLRQGSPAVIQVLADSNLQPFLDFRFDGGELIIRHKQPLRLSKTAKVMITAPDLKGIEVEGAAEIRIPDTLRTESFELDIKGAAMADLLLDCKDLKASVSGAGEIRLKGRAERATTRINGAGNLKAADFLIRSHDLRINGAGDARTLVTDTLRATINGAGKIEYKGSPVVIPDINGVGSVKALGE